MQFPFYPKHEHACPNVGQCPHLGGAALGTLVLRANAATDTLDRLHRTLNVERKRNSESVAENLRLEQELALVKLELKLERQNKFAANAQQNGDLRPLVVLRKITFGHRSDEGVNRMAALITVGETARRRGHRVSDIYFELFTRPPDRVLRRLYADA